MYFKQRLIIFTIALIVGGPFLAIKGARDIAQTYAAQDWPTAPGVIVDAGVWEETHKNRYGMTSISYDTRIEYAYEVDQELHHNNRVTFGTLDKNSLSKAESLYQRYTPGTAVQVAYNPADPNESVLETKITGYSKGLIVGGIAALIVGLLLGKWQLNRSTPEDANDEPIETDHLPSAGASSRPI
ncbi:MAG: DUF3592 domain-containing protein [Planctomycetota bacterium]